VSAAGAVFPQPLHGLRRGASAVSVVERSSIHAFPSWQSKSTPGSRNALRKAPRQIRPAWRDRHVSQCTPERQAVDSKKQGFSRMISPADHEIVNCPV
jgi:hypothetical protein